MISTIFLSGMVVSILIELLCYHAVLEGRKIDSYPRHYLRYNKYQLFRSWFLWSAVRPLVTLMTIVSSLHNMVKK